MQLTKQQLLISYLISSQELFIKTAPIIQTKYFDPSMKQVVNFVKEYFDEFKAPPTSEMIKAETGHEIDVKTSMTRAEISYAEKQLETFCRHKAIEQAILASPALLEDERYGEIEKLIKDAITVGMSRNIGLDYFGDPEQRLKLLALNNNSIPTLWKKLDYHLGGGLNRKEMIIFAAPPGVGKSLTMSNLAKNLMSQNLNGVYITLELSEEVVAKRFDSMFSGVQQTDILQNITDVSVKVNLQKEKHGTLHIKRMTESSTNANHIRAYLKEFEIINGYIPDFICVDYLDLMCSCQAISAENTFARDKFISEELRAIANDFNMIMITASQLNRSAQLVENIEDVGQAHIAGGISKVNTTDNLVAILQTPQQKARGEMIFKLMKTRSSNGVGNYYMLNFNPVTLILENLEDDLVETNRMAKSISSYINKKRETSQETTQSTPSSLSNSIGSDDFPFQV